MTTPNNETVDPVVQQALAAMKGAWLDKYIEKFKDTWRQHLKETPTQREPKQYGKEGIEQDRDELGRFAAMGHKEKASHLKTVDRKAASKLLAPFNAGVIREIQKHAGQSVQTGKRKDLLAHTHPPGSETKPAPESKAISNEDAAQSVADAVRSLGGEGDLVPLHKIRAELAKRGITERIAQDAAIHAARGEQVTASNLEGRHGTTDEEREAAIPEEGNKLGFLSLRTQ